MVLFITLNKMILTFEGLDEILTIKQFKFKGIVLYFPAMPFVMLQMLDLTSTFEFLDTIPRV